MGTGQRSRWREVDRREQTGAIEDEEMPVSKVQPKDYSYHTVQQSKTAKTHFSSYKGKRLSP